MIRVPTHRPPTHPGQVLLEEFLKPLEINQEELARRMDVPLQQVNVLVDGRNGVTADTALRLALVFGTTPVFWTNHQLRWDLYHAREAAGDALEQIEPLPREIPLSEPEPDTPGDRITVDPRQCGGRPCIRGMRIRVLDVLDLLAAGMSWDEILSDYPALGREDVEACLRYASRALSTPGHAADLSGGSGQDLLRFSGVLSEKAVAEMEAVIVDGCESIGDQPTLRDSGLIDSSPEVLGGTPVFSGTRVPVRNLVDHLSSAATLGPFLEDFPSVSPNQAREVLALMSEFLSRSLGHREPSPGDPHG